MLIESCREGIILTVKAFPCAKRNEVRVGTDDFFKVSVTQIPEKGKANEAIRKQIIKSLNLRASRVELLQGETSTQKKFLLRNVEEDEIRKIIEGIKEQQSE
jgi:uncharacterized protein YggU (UPF0235/DUF167 family)